MNIKLKSLGILIVWLLLSLFLYFPSFSGGYVWDDTLLFLDNISLMSPHLSWALLSQPVLPGTSYFRPLIFLTWFLEFHFFGRNSVVSHTVNFAIYFLNVTLVYVFVYSLASKLKYKNTILMASIASLLYLVHPAIIESTVWISGRFDQLVTTFVLLGSIIFVNGSKENLSRFSFLNSLWVCLCFLLALFSKELGMIFLPILLCLYFAINNYSTKTYGQLIISGLSQYRYLFVGLISTFIGYIVLRVSSMSKLYHQNLTMDYIKEVWLTFKPVYAYAEYNKQVLFPFFKITAIHPLQSYDLDSPQWILLAFIALMLLVYICYESVKKRQVFAWLALCAFFSIVLVLHIIPMTINNNLVHERFMTLGTAFVTSSVVFVPYTKFFHRFKVSDKFIKLFFSLILGIWLVLASVVVKTTVPLWHSDLTLWYWMYQVYPKDELARYNYWYGVSTVDSSALLKMMDDYKAKSKKGFEVSEQILYAGAKLRTRDPESLKYLEGVIYAMPKFHEKYPNDTYNQASQFGALSPYQIAGAYVSYAYAQIFFKNDIKKGMEYFDIADKYLLEGQRQPTKVGKIALLYLSGDEAKAVANYNELKQSPVFNESYPKLINETITSYCSLHATQQVCIVYYRDLPFK